jgi:hypothetical protein
LEMEFFTGRDCSGGIKTEAERKRDSPQSYGKKCCRSSLATA